MHTGQDDQRTTHILVAWRIDQLLADGLVVTLHHANVCAIKLARESKCIDKEAAEAYQEKCARRMHRKKKNSGSLRSLGTDLMNTCVRA